MRLDEGKSMTAPLVFNYILEEVGPRHAALSVRHVVLMLILFLFEAVCFLFYVVSTIGLVFCKTLLLLLNDLAVSP